MAAVSNNKRLADLIDKPEINTTLEILKEAVPKLKQLLQRYKKYEGHPGMNAELQGWLAYMDKFLPWLESEAKMTPAVRDESGGIRNLLQALGDPAYHCPPELASRAKSIFDSFEAKNWCATAGDSAANSTIITSSRISSLQPPPIDHPIWGRQGIMHGFLVQVKQVEELVSGTQQPRTRPRKTKVINPACLQEKRNAKVFGHNGLTPGAWWPEQKVAHFHGAHGHPEAGISGNPDLGAYSIVISGHYKNLDKDAGETVWYSSDGSKDNKDPDQVLNVTRAALSLRRSFANHRPIRVLRSSKGSPTYSPTVGIRYDGLYRVVEVQIARNAQGGLYECFKLRRLTGQSSLSELRTSPTPGQVRDYHRINEYY